MATQTELEYGCSCCVYVERHLGNRAECPTWDTASGPRIFFRPQARYAVPCDLYRYTSPDYSGDTRRMYGITP